MITDSKVAAKLELFVSRLVDNHTITQSLRNRFEFIDRAIARELIAWDGQKEKLASQIKAGKLPHIELPLTFIQYDSGLSYLAGLFASGVPMFRAVASKDLEAQAGMMSSLIARDQARFGWPKQLMRSLGHILRYNVTALEVQWTTKGAINVASSTREGSTNTAMPKAATYEGNSFKALDMYNIFYDPSVEVSEIHENGSFAGYLEKWSYIRLKREIHKLDQTWVYKRNLSKIFRSPTDTTTGVDSTKFYTPQIRQLDNGQTKGSQWENFFGLDSINYDKGATGEYLITTCYARIIPAEFGMTVPKRGAPAVYKFILVNGMLIYAEPVVAGHEYLPIIFGQGYDDAYFLQSKSFCENIMPLQELGTSIINGTVDAMRRNVSDRGLYNKDMISEEAINSRNPIAKIPVKMNRYNASFDAAYRPLDYRDSVTPQFTNNLGLVLGLAEQTNGVNKAAQGNFVKGNKTLFEFDTIMSRADARLQLMGVNLENSFFFPLKHTLKINYLMNAKEEVLQNPDTGQPQEVNPTDLRKVEMEFKMADGLVPATKLANSEVLVAAVQYIAQSPELSVEYKVPDMLVSLFRQQGFDDLDKYRRSPEEQQAALARQQQLAVAQNGEPTDQGGEPNV